LYSVARCSRCPDQPTRQHTCIAVAGVFGAGASSRWTFAPFAANACQRSLENLFDILVSDFGICDRYFAFNRPQLASTLRSSTPLEFVINALVNVAING